MPKRKPAHAGKQKKSLRRNPKRERKTTQNSAEDASMQQSSHSRSSSTSSNRQRQRKLPSQRSASKTQHPAETQPQNGRSPKPVIIPKLYAETKIHVQSAQLAREPKFKCHSATTQVLCVSVADKIQLCNVLRTNNTEFHTFTEQNDKPLVVVLKGYIDADVNELQKKIDGAVKVTKIPTRNPQNPFYIVQFQKEKINITILQYHFKYLDNIAVKWEPYKRKLPAPTSKQEQATQKRPAQCRKCQRLGHTASNCGYAYRCVKCPCGLLGPAVPAHQPGECQRLKTTQDVDSVFCCNCGKFGHPASSIECDVYKRHVARISNASQTQHQARRHLRSEDVFNFNSAHFPPATRASVAAPEAATQRRAYSEVLASGLAQRANTETSRSIPTQQTDAQNPLNSLVGLIKEFEDVEKLDEIIKHVKHFLVLLRSDPNPIECAFNIATYMATNQHQQK